jgi:hypothetical protein
MRYLYAIGRAPPDYGAAPGVVGRGRPGPLGYDTAATTRILIHSLSEGASRREPARSPDRRTFRFARDSPLEGGVSCEPVSEKPEIGALAGI